MKTTDKELFEKYQQISKYSSEQILKEYKTNEKGLTQSEYEKRIKENGINAVVKKEKKSWFSFKIF